MELHYDPRNLIWFEAELWFQGPHNPYPGTSGSKTKTLVWFTYLYTTYNVELFVY